jgi:tetratricopeptide (TPR) repeat protein
MKPEELIAAGYQARTERRPDDALAHYSSSVDLLRTLDEPLRLAHTVRHVGDILRQLGRPEEACGCYYEALAIYRGHGATPPSDLANTIRGYALARGDLHETESAEALWIEARDLYASLDLQAGVDEADRWLRLHRAAG